MTKHFYTVKKLPLWIAVSAVILAVGIALFAIFGFNTNTQAGKSFELTYDAVVTIADGGDRVEEVCEDTFDGVGIRYEQKFEAAPAIDNNSLAETGDVTVRYLFGEDVTEAELQAAREVILATLTGEFEGADLYVAIRTQGEAASFAEPVWRGAVALAVVFIVAGAVAAAGTRAFFLPLLLPLAVSVYSSLVFGPTLYLPLKRLDDRNNAKKGRYVGKKKAEKAEE